MDLVQNISIETLVIHWGGYLYYLSVSISIMFFLLSI